MKCYSNTRTFKHITGQLLHTYQTYMMVTYEYVPWLHNYYIQYMTDNIRVCTMTAQLLHKVHDWKRTSMYPDCTTTTYSTWLITYEYVPWLYNYYIQYMTENVRVCTLTVQLLHCGLTMKCSGLEPDEIIFHESLWMFYECFMSMF